jgi:hypothetical protein
MQGLQSFFAWEANAFYAVLKCCIWIPLVADYSTCPFIQSMEAKVVTFASSHLFFLSLYFVAFSFLIILSFFSFYCCYWSFYKIFLDKKAPATRESLLVDVWISRAAKVFFERVYRCLRPMKWSLLVPNFKFHDILGIHTIL